MNSYIAKWVLACNTGKAIINKSDLSPFTKILIIVFQVVIIYHRLPMLGDLYKKWSEVKWSEVKLIYDRQSVGQSVLVSGAHLGSATNFSFPWYFLQTVAGLFFFCSALSDERTGLQSTVELFLGLPRAVTLRSKSRRTHDHILLSRLRLPNLEGQVPVYISPRNRVAQLYLGALGSVFVASYDSQGLRWRYSNPPPHGYVLEENWNMDR
jgi:hypothetical protein